MNQLYYIRKHGAYYGHDWEGYVSDFVSAGRYTKKEAESACKSCNDLTMIPVDVNRHNEEINNRIKDLTRLKICNY